MVTSRMIAEETARCIAAQITRVGMSKRQVSERSGIPYTTLNRKLWGHGDFTVHELALISGALKIAPSELLPEALKVVAA
jgi:predicted transcriptional regulator